MQIKERLEAEKMESSIYITLETLKYLKKGGRITPAAAAIGTVLNLKPVLQIQGEKLDAYAKVRGKKQAKRVMIKAMKEDFENRFCKICRKWRDVSGNGIYRKSGRSRRIQKRSCRKNFREWKSIWIRFP